MQKVVSFNAPVQGTVVGLLILFDLVSQSSNLFGELVFNGPMYGFVAPDSLKEPVTYFVEGDSINIINGIEGGFDSLRGQWLGVRPWVDW
jgi:hypothetical protein